MIAALEVDWLRLIATNHSSATLSVAAARLRRPADGMLCHRISRGL